MKGKALNPNAAAIMRYRRALEGLVTEMTAIYQREIGKFLSKPVAREYFAQDESASRAAADSDMTSWPSGSTISSCLKAKGLADDMLQDEPVPRRGP